MSIWFNLCFLWNTPSSVSALLLCGMDRWSCWPQHVAPNVFVLVMVKHTQPLSLLQQCQRDDDNAHLPPLSLVIEVLPPAGFDTYLCLENMCRDF